MVRLWGVQRSSGGDAGKLKLRNGVYIVTAKRNDLYDLRHATHPELTKTNVHVSYLARWRGQEPQSTTSEPAAPASPATVNGNAMHSNESITPQSRLWDQVRKNEMICFVMRDESPANLRTAEVVELASDKRSAEVWYWIDRTPGRYRPSKPIQDRTLTPEWADERGQTRINPTSAQRAVWAPRVHNLSLEDIEIVLPIMKLHTGGSVKPDHADKINAWLRNRAKTDKRAAKALRSIQQQIQQREQAQFEQHQSLLEQEMLGILRAGARDEATTTDEQPRSTVPTRNARFEQLFAAWRPDQRALSSVSLGEASACPLGSVGIE